MSWEFLGTFLGIVHGTHFVPMEPAITCWIPSQFVFVILFRFVSHIRDCLDEHAVLLNQFIVLIGESCDVCCEC